MEKITMPQAESRSADLVNENLELLKQIFPEVIKEGRVDLEALHDLLGSYADTAEERFGLNWAGKANARREAQKRSSGTLRPCPEESVDWDTTENLYIEGDNLEVLKLLQKSYHKQVKMIYIDPPYNTGKDFVYKDNYNDNLSNYLEQTGQDRRMSTKALSDSDGRYHSNWLNMMYPRLKLARNLLTDDGVIFISIDDNEVDNLKKICDEIFGEENFFMNVIIRANSRGQTYKQISKTHEYLLVITKSDATELLELEKGSDNSDLNLVDNISNYNIRELRNRNPKFGRHNRPGLYYPIYVNTSIADKDGFFPVSLSQNNGFNVEVYPLNSEGKESCWRWGKSKFANNISNNTLNSNLIAKNKSTGGFNIYEKYRKTTFKPKSIWDENGFLTESGTVQVKSLGFNSEFEFPKPVDLIKRCLALSTTENDVVFDFFSGSATTAHAVMELNAEDGGKRKYICVQIPEETPEDSEARKAKFYTIPEIAKERIRRAGKKILEEQKAKNDGLFAGETPKLDVGFKVFKLDSSNVNAWDSNPEKLEAALNNSLFNIKEDRTEDDLLYEILIKYGIELTEKINRHIIAGKTVYEMGAGSLIVCLADNITTDVAESIGKLWNKVRPEDENVKCRMVFKDSGFNGSDEMKTNTMLILKQHGIINVSSV
ncbi:site-specific DNA-methyltransferase [Bacteroides sp.]|uniref:site-specific DNA-methyltransferase n=1 Tax=Bacteroides sp. TaxID=29523 RepID=UPI00262603E2|nr:site-specific DNA-methyltransferase [Bacteroides sp.]MDD3038130.1 site-specific DNA-methyltransferase [Bacteroides sp.]